MEKLFIMKNYLKINRTRNPYKPFKDVEPTEAEILLDLLLNQ